jgi:hypothetical protein
MILDSRTTDELTMSLRAKSRKEEQQQGEGVMS